jgi:hypothetical protein
VAGFSSVIRLAPEVSEDKFSHSAAGLDLNLLREVIVLP